jgi:DNA-nicking Smr family endonuclease
MAGKRKGGGNKGAIPGDGEEPFKLPKAPEKLASPFKDALGSLKKQLVEQEKLAASKPPPPPKYVPPPPTRRQKAMAADDATALSLAMQGVKPLTGGRPERVLGTTPKLNTRTGQLAPFGSTAEDDARRRLEQLVADDISFQIERDRDHVRGIRTGSQPRVLRDLARRVRANRTLDLHGMIQKEARDAVTQFVRSGFREGLDILCIVHGKGHHSEGGQGVLRDAVILALTESVAAQNVLAFVTAPDVLGGSGALLVELKR